MSTKNLYNEIKELFEQFEENHTYFQKKVQKQLVVEQEKLSVKSRS